MKAADCTWHEIRDFSRDCVVMIPTGSLEQHGPHLPLATDTLLVTAVAEGVESQLKEDVLLLPTLWVGASLHHLSYPGSVSASFTTYIQALRELIECYRKHGFRKFLVLNGHGGNTEPNRLTLREVKYADPNAVLVELCYWAPIAEEIRSILTGPLKNMRHACEVETSLMLHLHPHLVRGDQIRDDGMKSDPQIEGLVFDFQEVSEAGSVGFASFATPEKGALIFSKAVEETVEECRKVRDGFVFVPIESFEG